MDVDQSERIRDWLANWMAFLLVLSCAALMMLFAVVAAVAESQVSEWSAIWAGLSASTLAIGWRPKKAKGTWIAGLALLFGMALTSWEYLPRIGEAESRCISSDAVSPSHISAETEQDVSCDEPPSRLPVLGGVLAGIGAQWFGDSLRPRPRPGKRLGRCPN